MAEQDLKDVIRIIRSCPKLDAVDDQSSTGPTENSSETGRSEEDTMTRKEKMQERLSSFSTLLSPRSNRKSSLDGFDGMKAAILTSGTRTPETTPMELEDQASEKVISCLCPSVG